MIEVRELTKVYGGKTAVDNVSFKIRNGRIYGLLGPNGAGKSTTMNIIAGCLSPTEGTVLVNGYDVCDQPIEAKRQIGYLPEQPPLFVDMTPKEYLTFVAEAKGVSDELIDKLAEAGMDADIYHPSLTKERIDAFHAKGIKLNCWTVDNPERAEELVSWGIDYITSNILE